MYGIYHRVTNYNAVVSKWNVRLYASSGSKILLEFLAKMPKPVPKQKRVQKSAKYHSSNVYLQVLGSGAKGSPNSLYLFADQRSYLFNCGEGTQRFASEHKIKLSRLEHVLVTRKTWYNIGGLPGLSLTLRDIGLSNLTLHGPEGIDHLFQTTHKFLVLNDLNISMANCSPSEDFEDSVMTVKYVLLGPHDDLLVKDLKNTPKKVKLSELLPDKEYEQYINDATGYCDAEMKNMTMNNKNETVKRKPILDAAKKKTEKVLHELQKKTNCSVAYICKLKSHPGTLDLEKCVEKGVPPGPQLGQLKNGLDVILPDGTLVLSKDVKTPDFPGAVFIVLDVPEMTYLKENEFAAYFDNGTNPQDNVPAVIVHYTPSHVFHHKDYQDFLKKFGTSTRHLILNDQNTCLGSEAVHRTQHKLHLLDSDIFPLLKDVSIPAVWNAQPPTPKSDNPEKLKGLEELKNKIALAQFQNIINMEGSCKGDGNPSSDGDTGAKKNQLDVITGHALTIFHLKPKIKLNRTLEPKLHIQKYIEETMDQDGFVSSLEHFRRQVESIRFAKKDSQKEYPKIVFLGTGSGIPNKNRNVSAIVLHIDEQKSMLLDCGEGTFSQIVRFYGPKRINSFLKTLKAVFVSHLHADHHMGLIGVIQARRKALEEEYSSEVLSDPLYLLAPGQIVSWLSAYDQQFEKIHDLITLIPNQNLLENSSRQQSDISIVLANMGVQEIRTCFVPHCPNSFAIAVSIDQQNKITYSGDTLPSKELVQLGEKSTLLIHEATMEDELAEEARMKMHSTTSQAIDIGRQMKAHYIVLTHFSQRYSHLPRLNSTILNNNSSIGIAFDNMQVTMSDLELLPLMYAPLQLMFAEHCVDIELKASRREQKKAKFKELGIDMPSADISGQESNAHKSVDSLSRSTRCRTASSVPTACGYQTVPAYRESKASLLRQETINKSVAGVVQVPRSQSISPSRISRSSTPTRTTSAMSNVSVPENVERLERSQDRSKILRSKSPSLPVDTRPKILKAAARPLDVKYTPKVSGIKKTSTYTISVTPPCIRDSTAGYGRPLVTPTNRRLEIRRDNPNQNVKPASYDKVLARKNHARYITKKENNEENKPTSVSKAFNKIKCNQKSPTKESTMIGESATSLISDTGSLGNSYMHRPGRLLASNRVKSAGYQKIVQNLSPGVQRKSMTSFRDSLNDDLKKRCSEVKQVPFVGKPSSKYSNRSFKPQLEDITSSYLLLNQKTKMKDTKSKPNENKDQSKHELKSSKPKSLKEDERKKQLSVVKQQFQS